jgi:rubrerythrin
MKKENPRMIEQYDMAQDIVNKTGINIVTCGNCGDVLLHNINDLDSEGTSNDIVCPSCDYKSECCDFPDLFCV